VANNPKRDNISKFQPGNTEATELIRQKLSEIYNEEPDAKTEVIESEPVVAPSKHQKFMQKLVNSGKNIATIQTDWHKYYLSLPEEEKLKVWDEFYKSNQNIKKAATVEPDQPKAMGQVKNQVISTKHYKPRTLPTKPKPSRTDEKASPKPKVRLTAKHHVQSILFGLGMGFIVILIFLFGFFNEVIIAPFIQPSRNVSVPVIIGQDTVAPTSTPEVIIPKINVQIPVDYNINTTDENVIENDLEGGVIHFPTTVEPGQLGNAAFFGHSSNNIFNPGQYKFAFVLLHTLVDGDTFYLTYKHTVYVYKVVSHFIVNPNDTAVLGPVSGQSATATLITCDPPGTSINRLIVIGQQISPVVSSDTQGAATISPTQAAKTLPNNGPSLWHRLISSTFGKGVIIVLAITGIIVIFRLTSKRQPY
jgi:sortase A